MLNAQAPLRPYAFLKDGSAGRLMDRVACAIASDARAVSLLSKPVAQMMSDIKARVKSTGSPAIKAVYWSVRCPDPDVWGGMRARILLADPNRLEWFDFPHDPALPGLATLRFQPGTWQVLRYVPLRRATLLHRPAKGPSRIVKVKRPDRATDAAARLAATNMALGTVQGFAIPHLLKADADGTFSLSLCQGASLGAGLPKNATQLLRRIGHMHAALHSSSISGLPHTQREGAVDDLDLAAALRPDLTPMLAPLTPILRARPTAAAPVLCHGDFGFDQILVDNGALSLVDFDLCHAGEAAADIARFLVALAECPPPGFDAPAAEAAYLGGYADIGALPDKNRQTWFLAEAVAARLLVRLRKDQAQPQQIARLLSLLDCKVPA